MEQTWELVDLATVDIKALFIAGSMPVNITILILPPKRVLKWTQRAAVSRTSGPGGPVSLHWHVYM